MAGMACFFKAKTLAVELGFFPHHLDFVGVREASKCTASIPLLKGLSCDKAKQMPWQVVEILVETPKRWKFAKKLKTPATAREWIVILFRRPLPLCVCVWTAIYSALAANGKGYR